MNNLLFLILFLIQLGFLNAQERWGSFQGSIAGSHFVVVETCGDSVFVVSNGPKYERLYVTIFGNVDSSLGRRTVGDSVFIDNLLDNALEYLLYDYSLQVGDTLRGDWGTFEVINRTTEFALGEPRTKIEMQEINSGHKDIWIQGLGSIVSGYLTPGVPENIPDGGATFSCYYNTETMAGYFGNADPVNCELNDTEIACESLSTDRIADDLQLDIYPNPTIGELNVSFHGSKELKFDIINGMGITISKGILTSDSVLDLSDFARGLYHLVISDESGIRNVKPVIIITN